MTDFNSKRIPPVSDSQSNKKNFGTDFSGDDDFIDSSEAAGFNMWGALQTVFSVAIVMATLFTMWNPSNLFSNQILDRMFRSSAINATLPTEIPLTPTPSPKPRIGIVAGHWGNDSGAVCQDGYTEVELNQKIASLVRDDLVNEGMKLIYYKKKMKGCLNMRL
jgi:N-acetylmuramoyl-L-alanine amidase